MVELLTYPVPSLTGGVSREPPEQRARNTGRLQDNLWVSSQDMLRSRAPTEHLARVQDKHGGEALLHLITRDDQNQFAVVAYQRRLYIRSLLTGLSMPVLLQAGTSNYDYLFALNPGSLDLVTPEQALDHATGSKDPAAAYTVGVDHPWNFFGTMASATFDTSGIFNDGPYGGNPPVLKFTCSRHTGPDTSDVAYVHYYFGNAGEDTTNNKFAPVGVRQILSVHVETTSIVSNVTDHVWTGFRNLDTGVWNLAKFSIVAGVVSSSPVATMGNITARAYKIGGNIYRIQAAYRTSSLGEETQRRVPVPCYIELPAPGQVTKVINLYGFRLEERDSNDATDFNLDPSKAFAITTQGDVSTITNRTKLVVMDPTTSPLAATKYQSITLSDTGGAGITTDATVTIQAPGGPVMNFIFKPVADGSADDATHFYLKQDGTPTLTEAVTLLFNKIQTVFPQFPITNASATGPLWLRCPWGTTIGELTDTGNEIAIGAPLAANEPLLWTRRTNYLSVSGVRIAQGTAKLKAAVRGARNADGGDTNPANVCMLFNPSTGAATTQTSCEETGGVDDPDKGIWIAASVVNSLTPDIDTATFARELAERNLGAAGAGSQWKKTIGPRFNTGSFDARNVTEVKSSIIRLTSPVAFTKLEVEDSFGGDGLIKIFESVRALKNLPEQGPGVNGLKIRVLGDPESQVDDYIMAFRPDVDNDEFGAGKWIEDVDYGVKLRLDKTTAPHQIVHLVDDAAGTRTTIPFAHFFEFGPSKDNNPQSPGYGQNWTDRAAGDDDSNRVPSFIGYPIKDVGYAQNRFAVIGGTGMALTEYGRFLNWWRTSVALKEDTERIDVQASSDRACPLHRLANFGDRILAFDDHTIYSMPVPDSGLSPNTAALPSALTLESLDCPAEKGERSMFFAYPFGAFSGCRELFPSPESGGLFSADLQKIASDYIPGEIYQLAYSVTSSALFCATKGDRQRVYAVKLEDDGQRRTLASWFRFGFGSAPIVRGVRFKEDKLVLLIERDGSVCLETMRVRNRYVDEGAAWACELDRRVKSSSPGVVLSYDGGTNKTTIKLPFRFEPEIAAADLRVVPTSGADPLTIDSLSTYNSAGTTFSQVVVLGNHLTDSLFVGQLYDCQYDFNELYRHQTAGEGITGIITGRHQLANIRVSYENSGPFSVRVTARNGDVFEKPFETPSPKSAIQSSTSPVLETGVFDARIRGRNDSTVVSLVKRSHLPCSFSKAEFRVVANLSEPPVP